MDEKDLVEFEEDIKRRYENKEIHAATHMRGGYETELISLFNQHVKDNDYLLGYWAMHIPALLKGVPAAEVLQKILDGKSISLWFPKQRVYSSAIVGSLCGVATGLAWSIKRRGGSEKVVAMVGDMTAETGIFHESLKYSVNFDLPLLWVVEDNGLSVMTDTRKTWGSHFPWFLNSQYMSKIAYFKYTNTFPHSGVNKRISF